MNDIELADAVIALGVGHQDKAPLSCDGVGFYTIDDDGVCAELFVHDWRVAGELMERCAAMEIDSIGKPWWVACNVEPKENPYHYFKAEGASLPRTLIEACVEALHAA